MPGRECVGAHRKVGGQHWESLSWDSAILVHSASLLGGLLFKWHTLIPD